MAQYNRAVFRCTFITSVLFGVLATAQVPQFAILEIETANRVDYVLDNPDPVKFATSEAPQNAAVFFRTFQQTVGFADIVRVQGNPVRGNMVIRSLAINLSPNPGPTNAIADIQRGGYGDTVWEIHTAEGQLVGSLFGRFTSGPGVAPGGPAQCNVGDYAMLGGTGAFVGVKGVACIAPPSVAGSLRQASMQEAPRLRRNSAGGTNRYVFQLIAPYVPEVVIEQNRPAVFHADFSPVTASAPARAGEPLIVMAAGVGPTAPALPPGQTFRQEPLQQVTSPVSVWANGTEVPVTNAVGWPGTMDRYRVDFVMPSDTAAGQASLQLSAAWVKGASVVIATR